MKRARSASGYTLRSRHHQGPSLKMLPQRAECCSRLGSCALVLTAALLTSASVVQQSTLWKLPRCGWHLENMHASFSIDKAQPGHPGLRFMPVRRQSSTVKFDGEISGQCRPPSSTYQCQCIAHCCCAQCIVPSLSRCRRGCPSRAHCR